MRKYLLFVLFAIAFNGARGQNMYGDDPKPFTGALLCGLNLSQVDGDSYYGYHKGALNAGAMVYVHFRPQIGMSMELLYSRKGSRGVTEASNLAVGAYFARYYMNVNYVEVPLALHVIYGKYDLEAGASFNYLINSSEEVIGDQPVYIDPILNRFNSYDVDWLVGATRKLYDKWFVNLRYAYSITSIRPMERVPYGYTYGNQGQFNNLFSIRLVRVLN